MLIFLLATFVVISLVEGALLVRASKRLLQFDEVLQGIVPVLDSYSEDLKRMSSAEMDGILVDHPEVLTLHKRNQAHKKAIESVVDSVTKLTPARPKAPKLPRPDWE